MDGSAAFHYSRLDHISVCRYYSIIVLIIAVPGADTTATTIAATFFYLARNPQCYERLAQEIRSKFQSGAEICGSKLSTCQYLRACIDEAMRMSPPIPGTLWREQASDDGGEKPIVIDGHVIPQGTYVGVSTYTLHHNEVSTLRLDPLAHSEGIRY